MNLVGKSGLHLNFNAIWENQTLPESLTDILEEITEKVYAKITTPASGYANITQWAKTAGCWESVKQIDFPFENLDTELFINKEEKKYIVKESKKSKELDKGIDMQIFVVNANLKTWKSVFEYYGTYKSSAKLSSMQLDILKKMSAGSIKVPSESQSKILYQLYETAKNEGFNLN